MRNPFLNDSADVFDRMLQAWQNNTNTCSIGKVTSITGVTVSVQPLIKYFDPVTKWETHPILDNIPISQMQTPLYSIRTPLVVGDIGLLLWFDREVYSSLKEGATDPIIPDSGDLNDANACVFIPIMQPFTTALPPQSKGVEFVSIEIKLMEQLLALLSNLSTFLTAVAASPSGGALPAYAGPIATACGTLNTYLTTTLIPNFTTFKGDQ